MTYVVHAVINNCADLTGKCVGESGIWQDNNGSIKGLQINKAYNLLERISNYHTECGCIFYVLEAEE